MTNEIRFVLLKPGDVLLIGNLPSFLPEDLERLHETMFRLLDVHVIAFEDDIAIDRLSAEDLARRTGHPEQDTTFKRDRNDALPRLA